MEGGSTTNYTLNDPIYELAGEGIDLVYAIGDYWLYAGPAHVELLSSADSASTVGQDLTGNDHVRHIYGNNGRNTLIGGEADNTILGLGGNDFLMGWGGDDVLDGGAGIDIMTGGNGNDRYQVDDSGDVISEAPNIIRPDAGNDIVYTSADYRVEDDIETLVTTNSAGTASLSCSASSTTIHHRQCRRQCSGHGQGGTDSLTAPRRRGNLQRQEYGFAPTAAAASRGGRHLQDFQVGVDMIKLDLTRFTAIAPASTGFFEVGTTATSATTRILYDPATGNLLYDVDGNAGGASADPGKLFARLQTGLSLAAGDFILQANQAPEAHDDNYALNVGATYQDISIYPQQNDFDLDGLRLWVTKVGVGSGPMVDIGVGQDRTFVGGVYGTLQSHGNKSNHFDYRLEVNDPDTLAIAPGTTVFETYTYEDGRHEEGTASELWRTTPLRPGDDHDRDHPLASGALMSTKVEARTQWRGGAGGRPRVLRHAADTAFRATTARLPRSTCARRRTILRRICGSSDRKPLLPDCFSIRLRPIPAKGETICRSSLERRGRTRSTARRAPIASMASRITTRSTGWPATTFSTAAPATTR